MTMRGRISTRRALVAVLAVVLTLAGVARILAQLPTADPGTITIAGIAFPLCHAAQDPSPGSQHFPNHDCCEHCGLFAAVALPDVPTVWTPASFEAAALGAVKAGAMPPFIWLRTPRQPQAPPTV